MIGKKDNCLSRCKWWYNLAKVSLTWINLWIYLFRFEEKTNTIEQLENQLRKLHQATEALVWYRKDLGYATNNVSKSLAVLSGSEENSGLSAAIAQLSSVQEKIASIHQEQANVEFFELSELMKDYLGLVGAVKNVFNVSSWVPFSNLYDILCSNFCCLKTIVLNIKYFTGTS